MGSAKTGFQKKYRLRQVADMYWLIDVTQAGVPYEPPVALNEAGARICRMLGEGADTGQIVEAMSAAYEISAEEAREDVKQFMEQLEGCAFASE